MVGFVAGCGAVHSGLQPTPLGNPDLQTGHAKPTIIKDQKSGEEKYVNVPTPLPATKKAIKKLQNKCSLSNMTKTRLNLPIRRSATHESSRESICTSCRHSRYDQSYPTHWG